MAAGEKEVLLASTRLPIFFTAAAVIAEYREHFEEMWPAHLPIDPEMERLIGGYDPFTLEDIRVRNNQFHELLECAERQRLSEAGLSEEQFQSRSWQRYLAENIERSLYTQRLRAIFVEEPRRQPRRPFDLSARDFDPNAEPHERTDFKFDRRIVRETVIGALLGAGCGDNDTTIKYLNRGLPNGRQGVAWTHIRTAVEGFVTAHQRRLFSDSEEGNFLSAALMQHCVRRVQIADHIWLSLSSGQGGGGNPITELMHLIETGEFHSMYRAADAAVHLPAIDPAGDLRILERKLKVLKDALAVKLAEEKSA